MSESKDPVGCAIVAFTAGCVIFVLFLITYPIFLGTGGWGPVNQLKSVHVTRLYVDHSGDSSSYMVATDQGIFEVDNGIMLGVKDADKIYGGIKEGGTYDFTTRGNEVLWWFDIIQEYRYIVSKVNVEPSPEKK